MTKISSDLLQDTYNLVSLAREAALAKGKHEQANRLDPVVESLRSMVSSSRQHPPASESPGVFAQEDFQTLLEAMQSTTRTSGSVSTTLERTQILAAMVADGMPEVEIARQLGVAREEVRLLINLRQRSLALMEGEI